MAGAGPVAAGRIGRPHGLDGSFHVVAGRPRLLGVGRRVLVSGISREIERLDGTEKAPIARLAGVGDRDAAAELKGLELLVEAKDLPELDDGEWWAHELEGCVVSDGQRRVGVVLRMLELPSCEALEVDRGDGGAPLLVPMVRDAVRRVDMRARAIDVDIAFLGDV
ncbi:MAG: ribosome maturation factor RimM [Solirubrobacteraceae bacterium]